VARQFEGARAVREWVSTDRLQYSSSRTIGDRWCLMSHAAGFIDPLFSRGLSNTLEVINSLAWRLIDACVEDDFSPGRFAFVERLEQGLLDYNDELVNCSYISFSNFRLWDAVYRVWGLSSPPAAMRLTSALGRYRLNDRDDQYLKALEDVEYPGLWWPESSALKRMMDTMIGACEAYERGEIDGDTAADRIFAEVKRSPITPAAVGWKDLDRRFIYPGFKDWIKFLYWSSTSTQPELRTLGRDTVRGIAAAAARGKKFM
jgi:FADH2 O2-dependent halogenase